MPAGCRTRQRKIANKDDSSRYAAKLGGKAGINPRSTGGRDARIIAAVLVLPCAPRPQRAGRGKDFPNRAIRIVVPFPAGGPADVAARLLGQKISEDWGQPVIVENRAGGNTVIGAQHVAKAAPDGYTLLMAIDSTLVMNQYLYKRCPTTRSTISCRSPRPPRPCRCWRSRPKRPEDVKELIAKAKAAPGKLNYGAGTITAQLMGYRFHKAAGIDIVYVPFKGTAETVNGLLTGSVVIYGANVTVSPLIASGKVRALAKLDRRCAGLDGAHADARRRRRPADLEDMSVWLGLVAPKGTPKPIIDKLQKKVVQIMADPAVREKSERTGAFPMTNTPESSPLHPPGGRPLAAGAEGNQHQIRLISGDQDSARPCPTPDFG